MDGAFGNYGSLGIVLAFAGTLLRYLLRLQKRSDEREAQHEKELRDRDATHRTEVERIVERHREAMADQRRDNAERVLALQERITELVTRHPREEGGAG